MLSTESEPMSPPILVLNVSPCSRLNGRLHSVCTWGCVCVCVCVCVSSTEHELMQAPTWAPVEYTV
jgi:hypothetical protein